MTPHEIFDKRITDLEHRVRVLESQQVVAALHALSAQLNLMEFKIMASLDETLAAVTEEGTKDDSIIALLNGIKQQLTDALSGASLPPAVQAKVDAIFTQATANSGKIQAAIDANTTP